MSAVNWSDLLDSVRDFERLPDDKKERANEAADHYIGQLAAGISGIGNLLACTASNGKTGLDDETATDIGWMLKNIGDLIVRLSDIAVATKPEAGQGGGNGPNAG
ncbi:hypothetical protein M8R19_17955 [Pseudomonas sp. R3.Fl]|jgi:hypothetical protein|uniref:hypothetical protein n=1 Tax=Pseudomonas sp. R3.Fl TaxID=2928708 RepID=UPI00201E19F4|nr:hypothetical protein [Pseudomonas sp. R3.Fl]MCL6690596.1 hypothetical protein [Pseudomonas sp. R3.Fl]